MSSQQYEVNKGNRDYAIRMGCEGGVYNFVHDYAKVMGMSASAALRRLALIGAYCESEHGHQTMPASYGTLELPTIAKKTENANPTDIWS